MLAVRGMGVGSTGGGGTTSTTHVPGTDTKSSMCLCLLASGPPREWRGHRLVDAAVFEPVPLRSALRDGCTHVLVLCTRPAQVCSRVVVMRVLVGT